MSLFRRGPTEPKTPSPTGAPGEPPADETEAPSEGAANIPGERGIPPITRVRSVQSRVSTVLTVTLMGLLAAGLMVWYYSGAIGRSERAQQLAQAAARRRASGDAALPSLGLIRPPKSPFGDHDPGPAKIVPPPPSIPVDETPTPVTPPSYVQPVPPKKTPAELELERRLGGPVLAKTSNDREQPGAQADEGGSNGDAAGGIAPITLAGSGGDSTGTAETRGEPTLASLLRPTATPAVRARVLPTQRMLLPKGAFIDCTTETAVSSALPGMTTCITATDTFGADGTIVLLERGTKLVGETRGTVEQGKPRLFVLWTEARSPTGVVVPLASPGTDSLGRSGLTGEIDRHWWLRFGTAILITVIDGAVQGFTQHSANNNSIIVVNPSTTSDVATEALRGTLNIRPTIEIAQGERIQILVARDVDFRSVYALHASAGEP
jgi:type IV secretion system protein VirB10